MMIDENDAGQRAAVAATLHQFISGGIPDDLVRGLIRWSNKQGTPKPIDVAPPGDGHILALVANDGAPWIASTPWAIVSRCDDGWEDERGIVRRPTAWLPLPDPQPTPTGWRPPEGTVWVGAAKGLNWNWSGWLVHVLLPDGSHDGDREPFYLNDPDEALRVASEQGMRLKLPVVVGDMAHESAKVIPFKPRGTVQ